MLMAIFINFQQYPVPPSSALESQWLTFLTPIAIVVSLIVQTMQASYHNNRSDVRAGEIRRVQDVTQGKVDHVERTAHAIHILTNSAMAIQLKTNIQLSKALGTMAHRLAEKSREPGDLAAAEAIDVETKAHEAAYSDHMLSEARITLKD
jgi:hypothetical protein